jgi:predicted N-acetyltransferase YhbS
VIDGPDEPCGAREAKRTVTIVIRPERPEDPAAIAEVNRLAFGGDTEARLVAAIREGNGFDPARSLVAVRDVVRYPPAFDDV